MAGNLVLSIKEENIPIIKKPIKWRNKKEKKTNKILKPFAILWLRT